MATAQDNIPAPEGMALQHTEETARQLGAFSTEAFEVAGRMAKALSLSNIVPAAYQGNIANVMVAMEYAHRIGASVLAVMQNLDVIHGRPSLRATFLIGTVNASGRFTPVRWRFEGVAADGDAWGCRAVATDKSTGEECVGPLISIGLAKLEEWYQKKGSKWKTIPELMLMYRAAAWWSRLYCPELSLGLHTSDEVEDMLPSANGRSEATSSLNERLSLVAKVEEESGVEPEAATPGQHKMYMAAMTAALKEGGYAAADQEAARHLWQQEHVGKQSTSDWDKTDYAKAIDMLNAGVKP